MLPLARFSPDGHHIIIGNVWSIVYLLPDFSRILYGTAQVHKVVQKLHIGEPVQDLVWDVHKYKIAVRTVRMPFHPTFLNFKFDAHMRLVDRNPQIRSSSTSTLATTPILRNLPCP